MADMTMLLAAADGSGLSGHSVRGIADNSNAPAGSESIGEIVRHAADLTIEALNMGGRALGNAVDVVSDKAFSEAANVGVNIASPQAQTVSHSAFSWSGYFQAIGILCLLLAILWFAVWCIRKYGKFNFLPRPGALPRDSLVMEAQMPLGPRKGLMVVRFLNRRLLLGVTEHQISLITEEDARYERPANDFAGVMDKVRNSGTAGGADDSSA